MSAVRTKEQGSTLVVIIDQPQVRNAVDGPTARQLAAAFREFDASDRFSVAVLTGAEGTFCSGFDLASVGDHGRGPELSASGDAPMGLSRMLLNKPVIAAVEGHAVAGGLELAVWCDLRVAAEDATFGVYCRRWGVPLVDGGTMRLPRLIGQGRALDMILTGRPVGAAEALDWGLVDRLTPPGGALAAALGLAEEIARFPQLCLRSDRRLVHRQWDMTETEFVQAEHRQGAEVVASGETARGAQRFVEGRGRHGDQVDI